MTEKEASTILELEMMEVTRVSLGSEGIYASHGTVEKDRARITGRGTKRFLLTRLGLTN